MSWDSDSVIVQSDAALICKSMVFSPKLNTRLFTYLIAAALVIAMLCASVTIFFTFENFVFTRVSNWLLLPILSDYPPVKAGPDKTPQSGFSQFYYYYSLFLH